MSSFTSREKKILCVFLAVMVALHFVHMPHFGGWRAAETSRGGRQAEAPPAPPHIGAIAMSTSALVYGTSYDYTTVPEAEQSAISYCRKGNSLTDCLLVLTFADKCGAIAIKASSATGKHDGGWGVASGDSTASAERDAMAACTKAAGGTCKIDYSYCSKGK